MLSRNEEALSTRIEKKRTSLTGEISKKCLIVKRAGVKVVVNLRFFLFPLFYDFAVADSSSTDLLTDKSQRKARSGLLARLSSSPPPQWIKPLFVKEKQEIPQDSPVMLVYDNP